MEKNNASRQSLDKIRATARDIRRTMIEMSERAGTGHISSGLSMVEILTVLYFRTMTFPQDQLILSKGHGALSLYATLYHKGLIQKSDIEDYHRLNTRMTTFPSEPFFPSLLFSSGSLGHGAGVGCGAALALKKDKKLGKIFVILSDGECQEGSVWKAALFAQQHKLSNLVFVIDNNRLQAIAPTAEVLNLDPFFDKWKSFGFQTCSVDGHDIAQLENALLQESEKPLCVIAETTKGKGIPFMENSISWHYLPLKDTWGEQARKAIEES